ncbi:AAA family ATPase [Microcoleus sp. A003_D6]|uniref:AAA family ATPase n=1 Tax=Microcoleus sp. A003_D6 TaxID=3055266 RepID=UPI002FD51649
MYFKHITLRNVGPIEKINYDFPFSNDGNPKPLILVGTNGSGKSILLSYLLNALMAAQQVAFDDAEVEEGKVYKLRSPQYIKNGATYCYARVNFGPDFSCYEWQLACSREDYVKNFGDPEIDNSFGEIPLHETSIFNTNITNNPLEVSKEFRSNCVLYFPANRFEQPAWLNAQNLNATAEFVEMLRVNRVSNRWIIQQSPLTVSKNWLMGILLDRVTYDLKISPFPIPYDPRKILPIMPQILSYSGSSTNIWEATTQLIKLIFRTEDNIRLGIGPRQNRTISIMKNEREELIHNIFQLSTGQTSILNIVLSILRDFDMSGASFEKLEDVSGVVIIDEIDAHLHADLQSNLLPAVIKMFPKIQFILTTHSPLFLLGMKTLFGDTGFEILSVPTGLNIGIEEFEEFQSAFDFYKDSNTFRQKIKSEIEQAQKPVIFVEGDYDIKYLNKAALLLGKESILDQIILCDGDGYGNLDNIWKSCNNKLAIALPNIIGLIYDCDTKKQTSDKDMAKKRVIPTVSDSPISKGIENLIPAKRIKELRESHPQFFDITPKVEKTVRGVPEIQPEICEINKSEKRNLCEWLCTNGTIEDFVQFKVVFDLIKEIAGLGNQQFVSLEDA